MSIQYTVRADVFDISQTSPLGSDRFLVDSNIWLWLTYSKAGHGVPSWRMTLMTRYANFVQSTLLGNAKVCYCGLSLAELSHAIEKIEREIYMLSTGNIIRPKEFRHNLNNERSGVVSEINAAWVQVTSFADQLLPITIDLPTATSALSRQQNEEVDGYDSFILESMRNFGVVQTLTDDGDFATVPGIHVFTANTNVIQAARSQGRLVTR